MHGLLVILLLSSCAAFHPPAVAVISSRSPHRTISLITRRSSALYSCSQQDDEIPLVLPEIVLEESEAAVSSRETQSDAYKWTGFLLASTAFDVISKSTRMPSPALTIASSFPVAVKTLSAVVAYTLYNATNRSRLGSNTYKRLNLSLLCYSLSGMFAALASFTLPQPMQLQMSFAAVQTYVAMVSLNGYIKGVRGLTSSPDHHSSVAEMMKSELLDGMKLTKKIMFPASVRQVPYILGAVGAGLVVVHEVALMLVGYNKATLTAVQLMTRLTNTASASLVGGVLVSISDACRRSYPLNSHTFCYLNAGVSAGGLMFALSILRSQGLAISGARKLVALLLALLISASSSFHAKSHWQRMGSNP